MISVGGITIKNFRKEISLNGVPMDVEFVTMNCVEKQLYQVYLPYNGNKIRIHVQRNEQGEFKIMGNGVCPPEYLPLEKAFEEAIRNNG